MRRQLCIGGLAAMLVCFGAIDARSQTATLSGYIKDETGAVLQNVSVVLTSETTGFTRTVQSNDSGQYALVEIPTGSYSLLVEHPGFQRVLRPNLALDAASLRRVDIILSVGAVADTVQVSAPDRDLQRDTTGMGTLIRPDEVEHLPIAGRSIQKLITMAPGVIPTSASSSLGEFSVHGQRASANYLTIDGVSGNVSTETTPAAGQSSWGNGALPGYSPSGFSNNLFSLDAVEEVRIQTSSYAPEYGRTPGAQISVVTKSGTAKFAGSAYEYFRDDAMDARDFFVNAKGLDKPVTRFNTFGATVGGPLPLPSLFFFANYEGQRLFLPRYTTTGVPTQAMRDRTSGPVRMLLDAFPLPNGRDLGNGMAEFAHVVNDSTHANVGAWKVDYTPGAWRVFGRVHIGATDGEAQGASGAALSELQLTTARTITTTFGANLVVARRWFVESRLNYTTNTFEGDPEFAPISGAQPLPSSLLSLAGNPNIGGSVSVSSGLGGNTLLFGRGFGQGDQRQLNSVVSATTVAGGHTVKVGTDVRSLFPQHDIPDGNFSYDLGAPASIQGDRVARVSVTRRAPATVKLLNLSFFAQDQWQVTERLALTYGVRWDINPAPRTNDDRLPHLVEDADDPVRMRQRAPNDSLWRTDYRGIAPRVAAAYRLPSDGTREQVVRAAVGLFYDMGWANATLAFARGFPFTSSNQFENVLLPLDATSLPPLPAPDASPGASTVYAFPDRMSLPRSPQWNVGYEFSSGRLSASATYVGSRGNDLTRTLRYDYARVPGAAYRRIDGVDSNGRSEYDGLELQLRLRPNSLLNAEASYTLARSNDNVSDSVAVVIPASREHPDAGWGPSSFDARHTLKWRFGFATPAMTGPWRALGNTSVYLSTLYQSALPGSPEYSRDIGFGSYTLRADVVPGVPVYLEGSEYPGGRRINPAAFVIPTEPRQGTAGRNSLRAFPLSQVDLAVKRRLPISKVQLELGIDVFNLFNQAQFGRPQLFVTSTDFGLATRTFANDLGTGANGRGLSPLFQPGGPRSVQITLRASF